MYDDIVRSTKSVRAMGKECSDFSIIVNQRAKDLSEDCKALNNRLAILQAKCVEMETLSDKDYFLRCCSPNLPANPPGHSPLGRATR